MGVCSGQEWLLNTKIDIRCCVVLLFFIFNAYVVEYHVLSRDSSDDEEEKKNISSQSAKTFREVTLQRASRK